MRTLTLLALLLTTTFYASAEDVKLKITYKEMYWMLTKYPFVWEMPF